MGSGNRTFTRCSIAVNHMDGSRGKSASSLKYKIQLQPVFEIANIRENSLAAKVVC
jgi:hypothetical protein